MLATTSAMLRQKPKQGTTTFGVVGEAVRTSVDTGACDYCETCGAGLHSGAVKEALVGSDLTGGL